MRLPDQLGLGKPADALKVFVDIGNDSAVVGLGNN
jgi:hypothetical protein